MVLFRSISLTKKGFAFKERNRDSANFFIHTRKWIPSHTREFIYLKRNSHNTLQQSKQYFLFSINFWWIINFTFLFILFFISLMPEILFRVFFTFINYPPSSFLTHNYKFDCKVIYLNSKLSISIEFQIYYWYPFQGVK